MRVALFLMLIVAFFYGCETKEATQAELVQEEDILPTHIATFDVEGMMCQKGCGATIRKGLYKTGGVSEVEVSFDEENPINKIVVYFDIKKTSTDKIIDAIADLPENRYSARLIKVTESTISSVNVKNDEQSTQRNLKGVPAPEVSTESVSFPNLTKLLNSLIN